MLVKDRENAAHPFLSITLSDVYGQRTGGFAFGAGG